MSMKDLFEKDWQELESEGILFTSLSKLVAWAGNSLWPVTSDWPLCIEMMAATNTRHDSARFGSKFRASPPADVMIVAGRLSRKMAGAAARLRADAGPQMGHLTGACASQGHQQLCDRSTSTRSYLSMCSSPVAPAA